MRRLPILAITFMLFLSLSANGANHRKGTIGNLQQGDYGYLYCHMSDNGEWTAYALSRDGVNYHDLLGGDSIFSASEHARIEGGTRDAFICRKHDGSGYLMVTTDMQVAKEKSLHKPERWANFGIDLYTSDDLINWQSKTFDFRKGPSIFCDHPEQSVYKDWSKVRRVWAPQIFWDSDYKWENGKRGGYMIYFSMLNRDEENYDRCYYCYADESFTHLTQPRLLFDWGYATIDADINYVPADGRYHMMIKKEGGKPGIFSSVSNTLHGPWPMPNDADFINFEGNKKCEGPSAFPAPDGTWIIGYQEYSSRPHHYRICRADKYLRNFHSPQDIIGVNGPQHGSFLRLTKEEYMRLQSWSDAVMNERIKNENEDRFRLGGMEDVNKVDDRTLDSIKSIVAGASLYARPVAGSSRRGNNPVLFLIGNSTMRTGTKGDGSNGQWGWGAFIQQWFDKNRITVENHALGGTSSRTFYNDLWQDVLKGVRKGDYVLIELGHNDNGPYDTWTARASIPGIKADTALFVTIHDARNKAWNGRQDTIRSYGEYMRMFIRDVRAKGAFPILSSLTPRNSWDNEKRITRKLTTFTAWGKAVAEEMQVPWIDLEGISAERMEHFGHWKTDYMFTSLDKIHTSRFGAENNAYSAALAIQYATEPDPNTQGEGYIPLKEFLNPLTPKTLPVQRKSGKPIVFITGDSTVKIDGKSDMVGWGQLANEVFDTLACTPLNCAKAGRSTRSYLNEGRWDAVYNTIQPGDIVLIEFGHNDIGEIGKGKDRGTLPFSKDTCHVYKRALDGEYEMVYSFGWYLRRFIHDVREKGGTPVLVSLTPRNEWPDGKHIERRNDTYGKWYREIAKTENVLFLDLHNITADALDKIGKEQAKAYYCHDHTHNSIKGARLNAVNIANGLRQIGLGQLVISEKALKKYLKQNQK